MGSEEHEVADRDQALRRMLVAQGRQKGGAPLLRGARATARRVRPRSLRTAAVTLAVAAAVTAVSAITIGLGRSVPPAGGRGGSPSVTQAIPTPAVTGRSLAVFTDAGGPSQTETVFPEGDALAVTFVCTGGGTLAIHIPRDEDQGTGCGARTGGETSGGSNGGIQKGITGPVAVTVTASDRQARWTVTVRAVAATYVSPTAVATARASDGTGVPFCTSQDLTAAYEPVRQPDGVDEVDGGQIAFTNVSGTRCALAGYPRLQFEDRAGALVGRHSNEREDQRMSTDGGISAVLIGPRGTAWVQLDYYNRRYFTNEHSTGSCPTTASNTIHVDLANADAAHAQHGTLDVNIPTTPACTRSTTLQLFNTAFVDYPATPGR